jgi:hypothetical protein
MSIKPVQKSVPAMKKEYEELVGAHRSAIMRGDSRRAEQLLERIRQLEKDFEKASAAGDAPQRIFAVEAPWVHPEPDEQKMTLSELLRIEPVTPPRSIGLPELEHLEAYLRSMARRDGLWLDEYQQIPPRVWSALADDRGSASAIVAQCKEAERREALRREFLEWRRKSHEMLDSTEVQERFMSEGGLPKSASNDLLLRALQFVLVASEFDITSMPQDLFTACKEALKQLEE